jgi:plastocyanin
LGESEVHAVRRIRSRIWILFALVVTITGGTLLNASVSRADFHGPPRHVVLIPATDKFVPFNMTVHVGDTVTWINNDTDDHTIVANDAFNTGGHHGLNVIIPGTDSNNGKPGVFSLRFFQPGTFVYYCRFHSHLDADGQPVAPGPDGGIQDANGNFGTPMNGLITVKSFFDN